VCVMVGASNSTRSGRDIGSVGGWNGPCFKVDLIPQRSSDSRSCPEHRPIVRQHVSIYLFIHEYVLIHDIFSKCAKTCVVLVFKSVTSHWKAPADILLTGVFLPFPGKC
jgi:hypothetical protein